MKDIDLFLIWSVSWKQKWTNVIIIIQYYIHVPNKTLVHVLVILIFLFIDEQLKAENRSQHIASGITSFTVIVAVSILSSILISAAITLAIWRLKGPYRWNRRVSQNMSRPLGQQGPCHATTQQPHHVAFDSRQRTNDYCFKVNNRPSHTYCSTIEVSTILPPSDINRPVMQRENSSDTTVYDIGSCTYEPVVFPVREENWDAYN